jgi:hypothetical protein
MVVSFVSLLLCSLSCQRNADEGRHPPEKFLGGTLPLQGQVGVISVYGNDTTGQRGVEFAVFNGHKPLFTQSRGKSHIETWQFEQGLLVLVTKTSESGAILGKRKGQAYVPPLGRWCVAILAISALASDLGRR